MASKTSFFPVDIFAVKKYGVERWREEFFWPVSDGDFVKLADDIEKCLRKDINSQSGEISDLLLILSVLRSEYWHFLHALRVIDEIKKTGKTVLCSDNTLWYKDILSGNPKAARISERERINRNPRHKIKATIANILRNMAYNFNTSKFTMSKEKKEIIEVYRSLTPIIKQYIRKRPNRFRFTSEQEYLPKNTFYKMPDTLADKINQVSRTIASELRSIARDNMMQLFESRVSYFEKLTESILMSAAEMLSLAKQGVGNKRIKLVTSGFGDFFSRSLYMAIRKNGGNVISFSHGGNIGLYNTPSLSFSEFALSDEFITDTEQSANLFEKIKNLNPPLRNNKVNIKSCGNSEFYKMWRRYGNRPLPEKIKSVMIIGFPHNQWRKPQAAGHFSLMQLELELRIVDILAKAGYQVIYKAHPNRLEEIKSIFENRVKVLGGYFQDYLDMADAFLFGSIRTTAFPIALCTNKPIIAFKMEDEPYKHFPDAMELLQKRCSFIHTKFDERNRIIFDKNELLEALSKKPQQPNTEFIETYYFPK